MLTKVKDAKPKEEERVELRREELSKEKRDRGVP
jgi:hypothetical protein